MSAYAGAGDVPPPAGWPAPGPPLGAAPAPTLQDILLPAEAPPPGGAPPPPRSRRDTTIVSTRIRAHGGAAALCVVATVSSCGFGGVNSLPLPGAVASGSETTPSYHVQIANVGTLESNSPVMIDDVVVGSVGKHPRRRTGTPTSRSGSDPTSWFRPTRSPRVGQTSLLGSMHLSLDPPVGEARRRTTASPARPCL